MRLAPSISCVVALMLVSACGPKRSARPIEDPPPWATDEGKLNANLALADEFVTLGQPEKAQGILDYLRSIGEDGPEVELIQGRLLHQQGLYEQAEPLLLRAEKRLPGDARPMHALGLLYADAGRVDDAIAEYERLVRKVDDDAKAWNNLGFLYYSQKRCADAVDAYRHAVRSDGANSRYKNNLGFGLFCAEEYDEAFRTFKSAVGEAGAWYNLGHAHELVGNWPEAHRNFNKALTVDPGYGPAREGIKRLETEEEPQQEP